MRRNLGSQTLLFQHFVRFFYFWFTLKSFGPTVQQLDCPLLHPFGGCIAQILKSMVSIKEKLPIKADRTSNFFWVKHRPPLTLIPSSRELGYKNWKCPEVYTFFLKKIKLSHKTPCFRQSRKLLCASKQKHCKYFVKLKFSAFQITWNFSEVLKKLIRIGTFIWWTYLRR